MDLFRYKSIIINKTLLNMAPLCGIVVESVWVLRVRELMEIQKSIRYSTFNTAALLN